MAYDKPKVTIDLQEYNELVKSKEDKKDDWEMMAKVIVLEAFKIAHNAPHQLITALKNRGISVIRRSDSSAADPWDPRNIEITISKPV